MLTAASILRNGGLVAFPTETVYGLGANALDAQAVEKIFLAKERPAWDPLIVHISGEGMLPTVVEDISRLPACARDLMAAFWPGPLTLLLPRAERVPLIVTAGRPLVGVRMPAHPVAQALIAAAGVPVAAPSANRFGRISPTRASHVLEDLDGRIDAVLDAGETIHGLESTVVDATQEPVILYRPGTITLSQIQQVCPAVVWNPPVSQDALRVPESLPAPGVGMRHYAPSARLVLIPGDPPVQALALLDAIETSLDEGVRIGVMLPGNFLPPGSAFPGSTSPGSTSIEDRVVVFDWGDWHDPAMLAHRLFAGLRALDAACVERILCPAPPPSGIGAALHDRLTKAARSK